MLKKIQIDGLQYIPAFITKAEEKDLITTIVQRESWNCSLKRRTQHYGYNYSYDKQNTIEKVEPMLVLFQIMKNKIQDYLKQQSKEDYQFDMLIVNQYEPGQGISPHIDNPILFDHIVANISLASDIIMELEGPKGQKKEILLERNSLLILKGDSRYKWKHSIASRKKDNGVPRKTRYSLTYRKVINKFK